MTRLPTTSSRARAVAILAALGIVAAATAALAATDRRPRVDHLPRVVNFRDPATVRGHLENAQPGDALRLQRRWADGAWQFVEEKEVDDRGRAIFKLRELRNTARYRLSWRDPATGDAASSAVHRIRVRPRLSFELRPGDVMAGRRTTVAGRLAPARSGRTVMVQQRIHGEWRNIARVTAGDGSFKARFEPRHHGRRKIRVRFRGDARNYSQVSARRVMVYRRDPATWYGPGFYGNRTACGQRLTTETLGVAHRTLPCGTDIAILYRGRTITVPVIDRGPYASSDWDLTSKTARRLGFSGSDYIGVVNRG